MDTDRLKPDYLNRWVGRTREATAVLSAAQANLMQATLDRDPIFHKGLPLPPAWHWLYFHDAAPARALGRDGHALVGEFMPRIPLPRRMWAGGSIRFYAPLPIGATAHKVSTVRRVVPKEGRSGTLCFVDVQHEIHVDDRLCVDEIQTLVYRGADGGQGAAAVAATADMDSSFSRTIEPDAVLLFRYSALTFNSHRIHYDVDYCRTQEGYPGLVVHGPLTATLLLDLVQRRLAPGQRIGEFAYRAVSPLFVPNLFTLHGHSDGRVWATDHRGTTAMTGSITLA